MNIKVAGGTLNQKEVDCYIAHCEGRYPNREITSIDIVIDGDYVELTCMLKPLPNFDRIRRITGYLVGTIDRFNNAKRAEVRDRKKHMEV